MQRQERKILYIILGAAVVLRLAASVYMGNRVTPLPGVFDQISYHTLALRVLEGHGFSFATEWWPLTAAGAPTAHWSYLYTLYLSAVYALFGPNPIVARLLQAAIVGILHPLLAYLLGRRLFGTTAGLLAAAFTAVYVYFIYYAATLMTEAFYITGILAALYLFMRLADAPRFNWRHVVKLGLTLGAVVLLRQLFLLLIPFCLLWLWWVYFRRYTKLPLGQTSLVLVIIGAMILPFTLYNAQRFDAPVLLNTNAGYAFFWANHPIYDTRFQGILDESQGTYQELVPAELRALDEAAMERALLGRGLAFVVDNPGRYLLLSISRIPVYFNFWPSNGSGMISNIARVGSFGLFLPLMISGLVYALAEGTLRKRSLRDGSLLLLFVTVYTGIHLLSWALIRYRLPVDGVLLVYAGLAAAALWQRLTRHLDKPQWSLLPSQVDAGSGK